MKVTLAIAVLAFICSLAAADEPVVYSGNTRELKSRVNTQAATAAIIREVRLAPAYAHWSQSEATKTVNIKVGDLILLRLNENPGTGYQWSIKAGWDAAKLGVNPTNTATGMFEPTTSTSGSDDKVVNGVVKTNVPAGAGSYPYVQNWGDRRFDFRALAAGTVEIEAQYKRVYENRVHWTSTITFVITA
mmetsp:Transcript_36217/g.94203  ORF Transcript_36217/g.94203 Transcript_36217/m.94203 type:complete len:189 (-) Transcript_36217:386-952(-)|eukprot:CAMPEP_0113914240 /NCGR_PEP_ID=MMETSP0780_2-20120614/30231_1 /TAXON_ID=652834 /ORGANISM="Palpitomonas bilix" /LENGTH=188 /DNA_ID=CAMNT_0000912005 /DNA_START=132 /DNA_END=698 /DNA_ORIENTATION=- /assembly_acc=CAM_ASM_000599